MLVSINETYLVLKDKNVGGWLNYSWLKLYTNWQISTFHNIYKIKKRGPYHESMKDTWSWNYDEYNMRAGTPHIACWPKEILTISELTCINPSLHGECFSGKPEIESQTFLLRFYFSHKMRFKPKSQFMYR